MKCILMEKTGRNLWSELGTSVGMLDGPERTVTVRFEAVNESHDRTVQSRYDLSWTAMDNNVVTAAKMLHVWWKRSVPRSDVQLELSRQHSQSL